MKLRLLGILAASILIAACNQDKVYLDTPLDQLLASSVVRASESNDVTHFILPVNQRKS